MVSYDQRWVRRESKSYRLKIKGSLCDSCGSLHSCHLVTSFTKSEANLKISECSIYVPVISFADDLGLDAMFNTFRRGSGWYNRLLPGDRVRFLSTELEGFVGEGVVAEKYVGSLGTLLEVHAAMNHLMRDSLYSDAEARLQKILVKLYGRTYAALSETYSVIYVDPKRKVC